MVTQNRRYVVENDERMQCQNKNLARRAGGQVSVSINSKTDVGQSSSMKLRNRVGELVKKKRWNVEGKLRMNP
jgi:hypothetical protein